VCGQQYWLSPTGPGRTLILWIDTTTVHLSLEGQHLKILPYRLLRTDLALLRDQAPAPNRLERVSQRTMVGRSIIAG
jgi:hypothetical protein